MTAEMINGWTLPELLSSGAAGIVITLLMTQVKRITADKTMRMVFAVFMSGIAALLWEIAVLWATPAAELSVANLLARSVQVWASSLVVWNTVKPVISRR